MQISVGTQQIHAQQGTHSTRCTNGQRQPTANRRHGAPARGVLLQTTSSKHTAVHHTRFTHDTTARHTHLPQQQVQRAVVSRHRYCVVDGLPQGPGVQRGHQIIGFARLSCCWHAGCVCVVFVWGVRWRGVETGTRTHALSASAVLCVRGGISCGYAGGCVVQMKQCYRLTELSG